MSDIKIHCAGCGEVVDFGRPHLMLKSCYRRPRACFESERRVEDACCFCANCELDVRAFIEGIKVWGVEKLIDPPDETGPLDLGLGTYQGDSKDDN